MLMTHKPRPSDKRIIDALAEVKNTVASVPEPLVPILTDIREIMRLMLEELRKEKK
jgi:hypothetical protein